MWKLGEILRTIEQSKIFRDFFDSERFEASQKRTKQARVKTRGRFYTCLDVYGPRPIAIDFGELRFKVTTADVYPASLRGLIDHRREPRWIFARFHLNGAGALAEAMPAQTPGSGSDGGDPFRHLPPFDCNCR